jgi:predicted dehydrogenase
MSAAPIPVRIGVVGSGGMAEYHARKFAAIPGVVVTACADRQAGSARAFAARNGIPLWFASTAELAASGKVDAVALAVVDAGHARATADVLEHGLPVFAEKPLARTVEEAITLCRGAQAGGAPAAVNFSKRNAPAVALARRLLGEGRVGRVNGARFSYLQSWLVSNAWGRWDATPRWRWRVSPELSTEGVLGDLGSHVFDTVRLLLGEAAAVRCSLTALTADPGSPSSPGAPDSAAAVIELAGGALVTASLSWRAAGHLDDFAFEVSGDGGAIAVDLTASRGSVRLYDPAAAAWTEVAGPPGPSTYECFVEAVRTGGPGDPGFGDGLAVQRIIHACAQAARGGGAVGL